MRRNGILNVEWKHRNGTGSQPHPLSSTRVHGAVFGVRGALRGGTEGDLAEVWVSVGGSTGEDESDVRVEIHSPRLGADEPGRGGPRTDGQCN